MLSICFSGLVGWVVSTEWIVNEVCGRGGDGGCLMFFSQKL